MCFYPKLKLKLVWALVASNRINSRKKGQDSNKIYFKGIVASQGTQRQEALRKVSAPCHKK